MRRLTSRQVKALVEKYRREGKLPPFEKRKPAVERDSSQRALFGRRTVR